MSVAHMQVLLFLTALLSALTGVIAGPRADVSRLPHAEGRVIAAVEAVAPASIIAERPAQPQPASQPTAASPVQIRTVSVWPALLATVKLIQ